MNHHDVHKYKVALVGPMSVGKTSIMMRLWKNEFSDICETTIGCAFARFKVGTKKFEIWDTAGQERFKTIGPLYYRNASVLLFVFDLHVSSTFNGMIEYLKYFYDAVGNADGRCKIIFIGNKSDLEHDDFDATIYRFKSDPTIKLYKLDTLSPIFVSAKTGENISKIIEEIARCVAMREEIEKPLPLALEESPVVEASSCSC